MEQASLNRFGHGYRRFYQQCQCQRSENFYLAGNSEAIKRADGLFQCLGRK